MQLRYGLLAELVAAAGEGDALAAFEGSKPPQDQARGAAPARPEEDGAQTTLANPAGKDQRLGSSSAATVPTDLNPSCRDLSGARRRREAAGRGCPKSLFQIGVLRGLMDRMGHSATRAALIYMHGSDTRQREIADTLSKLAGEELKPKARAASDRAGKKRSGTLRGRQSRHAS